MIYENIVLILNLCKIYEFVFITLGRVLWTYAPGKIGASSPARSLILYSSYSFFRYLNWNVGRDFTVINHPVKPSRHRDCATKQTYKSMKMSSEPFGTYKKKSFSWLVFS